MTGGGEEERSKNSPREYSRTSRNDVMNETILAFMCRQNSVATRRLPCTDVSPRAVYFDFVHIRCPLSTTTLDLLIAQLGL